MTNKYLHRIDAIRGIAILLVLSYHTLLCLYPNYEAKTYGDNGFIILKDFKTAVLNFNPIGQGWVGVELFLVISGFLIHLIYLQHATDFKWKAFFSKRFWRIYPPYLLVLSFLFMNNINVTKSGIIDFFAHAFLVHNLSEATYFSFNPSFWSIALEAQLYLIYPIYIVFLKYFGSTKTTIILLLTSIVYCIVAYVFGLYIFSFSSSVINYWFIWAAGAFLADRYHQNKRFFKNPLRWFLAFYLLFFIFKLFNFFTLIAATLTCVAFVEFVLYSNFAHKLKISKISCQFLSHIGLMSYSIYLIHQPYLSNLLNFFNPINKFTTLEYSN